MAVFTDDFTGAENQALEDRSGWTKVEGGTSVIVVNASNQLRYNSGDEISYLAPDTGSADHYAQADLLSGAVSKAFFPLCVRMTDKNNFVGGRLNSGAFQLYSRTAGSFSSILASGTAGADTYRIEAEGNDITIYKGGVSFLTASTSAHNTVQTPGMVRRSTTGNPVLDNWESDALGAGGFQSAWARNANTVIQ